MMSKKTDKPRVDARQRLRWGILIVLVLTAGALLLPKDAPPSPAPAVIAQPTLAPQSARDARETAYDKDIATLRALLDDARTDADTRAQAGERLTLMVGEHQSELGVEQALTSAGFAPCLVLMQNGSLTVMVSEPELSGTQSATILSVCAAHTDVAVENIRIMTGREL